jgi:hypothetical protein
MGAVRGISLEANGYRIAPVTHTILTLASPR